MASFSIEITLKNIENAGKPGTRRVFSEVEEPDPLQPEFVSDFGLELQKLLDSIGDIEPAIMLASAAHWFKVRCSVNNEDHYFVQPAVRNLTEKFLQAAVELFDAYEKVNGMPPRD